MPVPSGVDLHPWTKPRGYPHPYEARNTEWDSWTCVHGWPVQGVWAQATQDRDQVKVNAVCRSSDSQVRGRVGVESGVGGPPAPLPPLPPPGPTRSTYT